MSLIQRSALMEAALSYARRGWAVFPLQGISHSRCTCGRRDCSSPGKHPLLRRGLHEATADLDTIEEWWSRWPLANIGIATGTRSGIVVIDIDLGHRTSRSSGEVENQGQSQKPRNVWDSLDKLVHKLPSTLTGLTGGGGLHLIYRGNCEHLRCTTSQRVVPSSVGPRTCGPTSLGEEREKDNSTPILRCTTGRLPGINTPLPGVDLRAEGGYIVAPPSIHRSGTRYGWLERNRQIAPAPGWLKQPQRPSRPITPSAPRFTTGTGTAYGLAVLRNQLDILAAAQVGERNHTLNRCAFIVARFVVDGHLADTFARSELHRVALRIGLTNWETTRTINSAFTAAS